MIINQEQGSKRDSNTQSAGPSPSAYARRPSERGSLTLPSVLETRIALGLANPETKLPDVASAAQRNTERWASVCQAVFGVGMAVGGATMAGGAAVAAVGLFSGNLPLAAVGAAVACAGGFTATISWFGAKLAYLGREAVRERANSGDGGNPRVFLERGYLNVR